MSTKADINKIFKQLEKFGYTVLAFGDNRPGRKAQKGGIDNIIFNLHYLIFNETKAQDTKDRLSDIQKETAKKLSAISTLNKTVFYFQTKTADEARKLRDRILRKDL